MHTAIGIIGIVVVVAAYLAALFVISGVFKVGARLDSDE